MVKAYTVIEGQWTLILGLTVSDATTLFQVGPIPYTTADFGGRRIEQVLVFGAVDEGAAVDELLRMGVQLRGEVVLDHGPVEPL